MHVTVTTTITARIPLTDDGIGDPEVDVQVSTKDGLPEQIALAAAVGACRSALLALDGGDGDVVGAWRTGVDGPDSD